MRTRLSCNLSLSCVRVVLCVACVACVAIGQLAIGADEEFVDLLAIPNSNLWVTEGTKTQPNGEPNWRAEDGMLSCAGYGFGFMRYDHQLCDFVLQLEYRIYPAGNSGIGVRGTKFDGTYPTRPSVVGYEIQIADDRGTQPTPKSTGSLYRHVAPLLVASREVRQWNTIEVECRGPHIRIELNGQMVQDVNQASFEEIKTKPLCGYLSLQCHNQPVEFRHIRLKILRRQSQNDD